MNQDKLDQLLKESLNRGFSPPEELDKRAHMAMEAAVEKKQYRFNLWLGLLSLALTLGGAIVTLPYIQNSLLQIAFIGLNISIVTLICFFFVVNAQNRKRKEPAL